jgi:hypothetical protein
MTFKKIVEKLDEIPEEYHEFYVPIEDGENKGKYGLQEITPLRNAVTHTKRERDEARKKASKVDAWEKLGKSPEEIAEMLATIEENETKKLKESGNTDALLDQHRKKWEAEKGQLASDVDFWRDSYQNSVIDGNLAVALSKLEATPEGADLLPDRLKARVKIEVGADKKIVARVLNEDGTPMAGNGADGSATFEDLVVDAKKRYPSLFKGTSQSGSGASKTTGRDGGAGTPSKRSGMSMDDKAKFIAENGQEAYLALPY